MTAQVKIDPVFLEALRPRIKRSMREFAETEVILPTGPRKGFRFSVDYMPFNNFIFDAFHDPYWRKMALVGSTQSGKTLVGTNIPLLYILFELDETVIFGIPQMQMARSVYQQKILPVIQRTRYMDLIPDIGGGSRGGHSELVGYKNGAWLRFMGAGGGDDQRSSETAQYILITEIDKMDDVGNVSEEADPVSQIEARSSGFANPKIVLESTVTHEHGRIWQEVMVLGSGGQIFVPCGQCNSFQKLEKDNLVYNDEDLVTAEDTARYRCEKCDAMWTDADKRVALQTPLLVHRGQTVDGHGIVQGPLPRTRTFGLRWNALYSPEITLGKLAGEQTEADKSGIIEKKKAMNQFRWTIPWKENYLDKEEISFNFLRAKQTVSRCSLREVPNWAEFLIMTVDVQKRWLYFHVDAWCYDMTSQVIDYGTIDIQDASERALQKALSEAHDVAERGYKHLQDENKIWTPTLCLVDTGYREDVVVPWTLRNSIWKPVKGVSEKQRIRMHNSKAIFTIQGHLQLKRQEGVYRDADGRLLNCILWFIDVDNAKALVHDRYLIRENEPGHTYIPEDCTIPYIQHLCAERREYHDNGEFKKWVQVRHRNDYLDCRAYSAVGALFMAEKKKFNDAERTKRKEKKPSGPVIRFQNKPERVDKW